MPDTAGDPAELDFVKKNNDGGVRIRRDGGAKRGPVGWEDDPSIPISQTPQRPRAATTTATYSGSQSTPAARSRKTPSINATVARAGTPEVPDNEDEDAGVTEAGNFPTRSQSPLLLPSSTANPPSLSPLSVSHLQKSTPSSLANSSPVVTTLLDQTEINSINGILNASPSSNAPTMKRKKSLLLGGLEALGIASKVTKSQPSQPMSSVSPESPVSPTRTISGVGNIAAAHKDKEGADMNWHLYYTLPPLSTSAQDPAFIAPLSTASDATSAPSTPTSIDFVNPNSVENRTSTFIPGATSTSSFSAVALDGIPLTRSFSIASVQSSNSFAYDDSFAQGLMFWGGTEYGNMRREWVVRKEKKANAADKENSLNSLNKPNVQQPEVDNNGHQDSPWSGMPIGAEEVWNNFLLGRFSVSRDDIYDKKSGSSESNTKGKTRSDTDASGIGFRKSPQQRLIIKRLRDDGVIMTSQSGPNTKQPRDIPSIPEDITGPSVSLEPNRSPASTSKASAISSTGTSSRRHFDSQHPTIVVHKHSKVPAFSISRQHRLSKDSPTTTFQPTSGVRLNVVLLAQRDVQEAFTNTETTKRLGTVLDRHQAVRAAFPEHTKGRTETVHQVKSAGQVELGRADTGVGPRYVNRPLGLGSVRGSVSGSVGTRSAPVFQSKVRQMSEVEEAERTGLGGSRSPGQSRENYKRAYGTLEQPPDIIFRADLRSRVSSAGSQTQDGTVPSKPSSILKRFLPWDSSSASSSKSSTTNSAAQSTVGSTRRTTPTQPTNSEVSPYVPPWLTVSSREQKEMQRHVLGQLEHSFENVGLLPAKDKKNSRKSNPIAKLSLRKKDDVLSCVPANSFFMLVPLWPAETDAYSHRLFPFENPAIPVDDRRYLLVFYKELPEPSKGHSPSANETRKIFPGFRALARQVTYSELQGTGVRVPEHGVSCYTFA
ncbi:hypothetical protein BDP27DRAFT_962277 [Rhodocollybia butyracea]|uniref:Uncharacterized protein n=1 Tax=Rhodocollybia butyracea TaxID=206335 RepID=A0A9P5Q0H4_9AGAR|nr:hypothetical protein BDP27DRAFT_962277 [Rhodocollybia butyracea]